MVKAANIHASCMLSANGKILVVMLRGKEHGSVDEWKW